MKAFEGSSPALMLTTDPQMMLRILGGEVPPELCTVTYQGENYTLLAVTHRGRLGYRELGDDTYQLVVETVEDPTSIDLELDNPLRANNSFARSSYRPMRGAGELRKLESNENSRFRGRATIFSSTRLQQQHVAHISQLKFRMLALISMIKCPCGSAWINPSAPEGLRTMALELGLTHYSVAEMPEWFRTMLRLLISRAIEHQELTVDLRRMDSKVAGLRSASGDYVTQRQRLQTALAGDLGDPLTEPIRVQLEAIGPQQEQVEIALTAAQAARGSINAHRTRAGEDVDRISAALMFFQMASALLEGTGVTVGIAAEETDRRPVLDDGQTQKRLPQ